MGYRRKVPVPSPKTGDDDAGRTGRIFSLRIDDGEDVLEELGGREIVGTGTVYPGDDARPSTSTSRAGGLRERAAVYLVVKAVIVEFVGMAAGRACTSRSSGEGEGFAGAATEGEV